MSKSNRKQLKQERKRRIKEGIALNAEKNPKEARLDSKVAFKEAKKKVFSLSNNVIEQSWKNKLQQRFISELKRLMIVISLTE